MTVAIYLRSFWLLFEIFIVLRVRNNLFWFQRDCIFPQWFTVYFFFLQKNMLLIAISCALVAAVNAGKNFNLQPNKCLVTWIYWKVEAFAHLHFLEKKREQIRSTRISVIFTLKKKQNDVRNLRRLFSFLSETIFRLLGNSRWQNKTSLGNFKKQRHSRF